VATGGSRSHAILFSFDIRLVFSSLAGVRLSQDSLEKGIILHKAEIKVEKIANFFLQKEFRKGFANFKHLAHPDFSGFWMKVLFVAEITRSTYVCIEIDFSFLNQY